MKFRLSQTLTHQIAFIARKVGYQKIRDRQTGQISYVRTLTSDHYPRFHLYVKEKGSEIVFDLHLDHARTRYQGQKAHQADYEIPQVREELARIYQLIQRYLVEK
jgi:hypothetical protein